MSNDQGTLFQDLNIHMQITDILEKFKNVGVQKTKTGDDRVFFLDEENDVLYCFGPSKYVRKALENKDSTRVMIVEYENGPYLQVGDNVYGTKVIRDFNFHEDHGIIITAMILEDKIQESDEVEIGDMGLIV